MIYTNVTNDTPIAMLNVGQLREALGITPTRLNNSASLPIVDEKKYVYGYPGIAQLFGCSIPTASRIKLSGKIDGAIKQIGRKIIVDAELALELAGKKNGGKK